MKLHIDSRTRSSPTTPVLTPIQCTAEPSHFDKHIEQCLKNGTETVMSDSSLFQLSISSARTERRESVVDFTFSSNAGDGPLHDNSDGSRKNSSASWRSSTDLTGCPDFDEFDECGGQEDFFYNSNGGRHGHRRTCSTASLSTSTQSPRPSPSHSRRMSLSAQLRSLSFSLGPASNMNTSQSVPQSPVSSTNDGEFPSTKHVRSLSRSQTVSMRSHPLIRASNSSTPVFNAQFFSPSTSRMQSQQHRDSVMRVNSRNRSVSSYLEATSTSK